MENNRTGSRWDFIDPSYADIPRPVHLLLNTLGAIGVALPYLTVLLPCFAMVWGADQLQWIYGAAVHGTISALMSIIKIAATVCSIEMLLTSYSIRQDWEDELRRIIHEACEEFFQPWVR